MTSIEEIKEIAIKKIKCFSEISPLRPTEKTLFLIDIDDTILSSPSDWGSVREFKHMVEEACKIGYTREHAKVVVYPRWLVSQSIIRTKLVDPDFPLFLQEAASSSYVMGFTARQAYIDQKPVIAEVTEAQLKKLKIDIKGFEGIEFNKKYKKPLHHDEKLSEQLDLYDDCQAVYHKGVLFCHDLNSKGDVFKDFFTTSLTMYCERKKLPLPDRVVFVDDGYHNLESMHRTCTAMGIAYEGYHIQSTNYHFDPKVAKFEEQFKMQRSRSFSDFSCLSSSWSK